MDVYINRFCFGDDSTLSHAHIEQDFICFILEDQVRYGPKAPGETAIPYGTFDAVLRTEGGFHERYKQRFANDPVIDHVGMIYLPDVPDFTWIQFHPGNTDEHTDGCPLTGLGVERRPDGENNYNIDPGTATEAYRLFYPPISKALLAGERVLIHIKKAQII